MNPKLEYIRVNKTREQQLESEIKQLTKLLKQANKLTYIIQAEDRDERTIEELEDHNIWIDQLNQQIKNIKNEQTRLKING